MNLDPVEPAYWLREVGKVLLCYQFRSYSVNIFLYLSLKMGEILKPVKKLDKMPLIS